MNDLTERRKALPPLNPTYRLRFILADMFVELPRMTNRRVDQLEEFFRFIVDHQRGEAAKYESEVAERAVAIAAAESIEGAK